MMTGEVVYEARYNPCIHESGFVTMSIHHTRKGAEMAIAFDRDEREKEWKECFPTVEDYCLHPFGEHEAWDVKETQIEE